MCCLAKLFLSSTTHTHHPPPRPQSLRLCISSSVIRRSLDWLFLTRTWRFPVDRSDQDWHSLCILQYVASFEPICCDSKCLQNVNLEGEVWETKSGAGKRRTWEKGRTPSSLIHFLKVLSAAKWKWKWKNVGEREETIFSHSISETFTSRQMKVKVRTCGNSFSFMHCCWISDICKSEYEISSSYSERIG